MSIALQQTNADEHRTSRRRTIWFVLSVLFTVGNVAGGVIAARNGEFVHAGVHALLAWFGGKATWRFAPGRYVRTPAAGEMEALDASFGDLRDRLQRIEQSVEAVAIEVERVGEAQRFMSRLYSPKEPDASRGDNALERRHAEPGSEEPPSH
jgi:hypothetical protein